MTAPRTRPHPRSLAHLAAVVVADDPWVQRHATELLSAAGFPLRETAADEADGGEDELVILLLSRDAAARVEAIVEHVERLPGAAVVAAMPGAATGGMLRRALRAGADGIVFDEQVDRALVATVRAVAAGQLTVPLAMRRRIAPRPLSYREKEILSLVVQGFTNRQIADTLFLAESTVKTHLSSAFGKLDARSRSEAAALVLDPDAGFELGLPIVGTPSAA
jgi:DNA-binding NarL/FixJ family response regulator